MKIQCDVCDEKEASFFCSADEAALCDSCDRRVHHANKLASKHLRFPLLQPSSKDIPRCDICQEKRALLFCKEDRAILCRECDVSIHRANEHTLRHNRFLLTGVKLSASASAYQTASSSSGSTAATKTETDINSSATSEVFRANLTEPTSIPSISQQGTVSTSSISEYLIETLPGWHVEDLLGPSCSPYGFCKIDDQISTWKDNEVQENLGYFPQQDLKFWAPQALSQPLNTSFVNGIRGSEVVNNMIGFGRERSEDVFGTVPQISYPSAKKSRRFW